jgi:hypothetical protein
LAVEEDEFKSQTPRKILEDRTIYASTEFAGKFGFSFLCDFGEARPRKTKQHDFCMPDLYRAPEVISESGWDHKIDIWSIGMLVGHFSETSLLLERAQVNLG